MKIFLARHKSIDDCPDWTKCCDARVNRVPVDDTMKLDMSTRAKQPAGKWVCPNCGFSLPEHYQAIDVNDGLPAILEMVDIDEHEYSGVA